jgi:hypothetical protein
MQINVEFKDPATGKEWDIEVPDDVAIGELLPAMLRESRLSLCGTDCQLLNQRTGTVYAECETLRERTLEGDTLLLVHANASGPDVRVDLRTCRVAVREVGNGWVVHLTADLETGEPTRTLVFRKRDRDALLDLIAKACRPRAQRGKGRPGEEGESPS